MPFTHTCSTRAIKISGVSLSAATKRWYLHLVSTARAGPSSFTFNMWPQYSVFCFVLVFLSCSSIFWWLSESDRFMRRSEWLFEYGLRNKKPGEKRWAEISDAHWEKTAGWRDLFAARDKERRKGKERAVRGRRDRGSSPLGQQCVFWGWTEWLCIQNLTGHQREGRCELFCVPRETRPTSDPCATHTLPSAAQESAFCSLCAESLWKCLIVRGVLQEDTPWCGTWN